ncbi:metallophosphoesterase [Bacillus sp. ISL-35]|uniref:metallophosphoesterase n=1 Tax=Bacillus sp. ISL-35 TaxID=2819122 RepID=UPI001BE719D6|nr:metallophosphoesterase [Bacillus sp. ISL-35]MBT2678380.1 metallophosphoesterase [Bacillus sp. ISL-35]MBT2705896.1 metallophosphoesterase [Chryseobacterium sp. ISL-80]
MSEQITRRKFIKKAVGTILAAGGLTTGGYFYAREVEPRMLDVTRHTIGSATLPAGFDGVKIIQFSDTHIGFQYTIEQLAKLVAKINQLNPDLIVFTGDLLDDPRHFTDKKKKITTLLSQLEAPLGKFAVYGNHDHGGYGSDLYKQMMEQSGFSLLLNDSAAVRLLDGSSIWITGIDDAMLGKPNLKEAMSNIPKDSYTILLSHAPDKADEAAHYSIQLQLSGHSHGGQIQIPFYGPLVTPPYAEKYVEGFYDAGNNKEFKLYVNRGLGTTRLPFRFLSQPELTLFTLKKTSS